MLPCARLLCAVAAFTAAAAFGLAAAQRAPDPWLESELRTTSQETAIDAGAFGRLQHFSFPLAQGTCGAAAAYGFAKCLLAPGGAQHWRVILAWARVDATRLANVAEDLSSFGPYQCEPPRFYLQPVTPGERLRIPLAVHERGGLAFFPMGLKALVPAARAAPGYALRIEGSDYMAILDAAGGCVPPVDPLALEADDEAAALGVGGEGGEGSGGESGGGEGGGGGQGAGEVASPEPAEAPGGSGAQAGGGEGDAAAAAKRRQLREGSAANDSIGSGSGGGGGAQQQAAPTAAAAAAMLRRAPGRVPVTSWVLLSVPPTWQEDLDAHVRRLREHMEWHQGQIGFTGHILYYDPSQASRLLCHAGFLSLLTSYRAVVVRWSHFPRIEWLPWDAQGLRLSHAYLGLWGSDAGLLPIDVDEFLVLGNSDHHPADAMLRRGAALRALITHCGGGAGAVSFERFALYCSAAVCPGRDEASVWAAAPPPALSGEAGAGGGGAAGGGGGAGPGWSWLDPEPSSGNRVGGVGTRAAAAPSLSRLAAYDLSEVAPHVGSKVWSTSACAFPASVHEARPSGLPGCGQAASRPACGRLVHLINAFHPRDDWAAQGKRVEPFSHPWWPAVGARTEAGPAAGGGGASGA